MDFVSGELRVLSVGKGDTKLSFDPEKPEERERAARIVTDMLKRGYAILIQIGEKEGKPLYQRAEGFDPATCEYLVLAPPEVVDPAAAPKIKRKRHLVRVEANKTQGVAVARSAGG